VTKRLSEERRVRLDGSSVYKLGDLEDLIQRAYDSGAGRDANVNVQYSPPGENSASRASLVVFWHEVTA
jgi:hypothetical protein